MGARKSRDDLTNKKAKDLFARLHAEYTKQYGELTDTALHIINDCAMLEQLKQACRDDIVKSGVMTYWRNGNGQEGYREHPLLSKLNQTTEQQRKLLVELKLTPSSRKIIAPPSGGDDFENF